MLAQSQRSVQRGSYKSDHVDQDQEVGYFYWPNTIPSVITFIPFCHLSPPTLALKIALPAEVTFRLGVSMKLEP